jgi:hypothetical protein
MVKTMLAKLAFVWAIAFIDSSALGPMYAPLWPKVPHEKPFTKPIGDCGNCVLFASDNAFVEEIAQRFA